MTSPEAGPRAGRPPSFDELMAEVMAASDRFGHREHVHLTWLAVRRCGAAMAISLVSDGIQRTARYAGAPQKYHATVSRAWVELVGHHAAESGEDDFTTFAGHHTALLDKRLLTRFYRPATLASPPARNGWVEPDLAPFPWQATGLAGRRAAVAGPLGPTEAGPHADDPGGPGDRAGESGRRPGG
jgi:hypothetical protein